MADTKLSALTAPATISGTDILYGVSDPSGTPTSGKFEVGRMVGPLKESSYSVDTTLTLESGKKYALTGTTARTFTVPSVGSDEDRYTFYIKNRSSSVNLTATLSDSDTFDFPGLNITSITLEPGAEVCLQYIHASTRFDFLNVVGKVYATGTQVYVKYGKETSTSYSPHFDQINKLYYSKNTIIPYDASTVVYGTRSAPYILSQASTSSIICQNELSNFNIFNDQINDATISFWMWDVGLTANKDVFSVKDGTGNYYAFYMDESRYLKFVMEDSLGSTWINLTTTTTSTAAWHHIAICKVGADVGMYLDGTQISFDGSFTNTSIVADLILGAGGYPNGANFTGFLHDFAIVTSNIFGAAPVVGLTDSFTVTANSFLNLRK